MAARGSQPDTSFSVNVKDFQGRSVVIKVNPSWAVAEVKQEISRHTSVPPSDFKLVFAGMTLADTQTLWVRNTCNFVVGYKYFIVYGYAAGSLSNFGLASSLLHIPLSNFCSNSGLRSSGLPDTADLLGRQKVIKVGARKQFWVNGLQKKLYSQELE